MSASGSAGRRRKRAPASSISTTKNRKSVSVRICVLKTTSVTESAAMMPAISPMRGEIRPPRAAMSTQVPASITA
jgi:hypothetical protein